MQNTTYVNLNFFEISMFVFDRAIVNTLLGRKGAGCVEVPSSDELDGLKAAAAKTQGAILR